ncbi:hypothetical protein ACQ86G_08535 [Roseateles chitinivorans]|uniref:hypothetical protein n=1 Tax=Roseateles chitinivorans TaxID=2917965 RepID=UPI003D66F610
MEKVLKTSDVNRQTPEIKSRHSDAIAKAAEMLHEKHVKRMAEDAGLSYDDARRLLTTHRTTAAAD